MRSCCWSRAGAGSRVAPTSRAGSPRSWARARWRGHSPPWPTGSELQPGDALCRQGEATDTLLFIDRGRVNVLLETESGRQVRLRVIDGRTVLGEMGFFMNAPRSATVLAEAPTVVYRLSRDAYARLVAELPEAAPALTGLVIRLLAERLKIANGLVVAYER